MSFRPTDELPQLTIRSRFQISDVVYLKIKRECMPGMVTGIIVRDWGVAYYVTWETGDERCHNDCELTTEFIPSFDSY